MLIMKGPPCQDPRVCLATLPGLAPYPGGKYSDTLHEKMANLQFAGGVLRRRPQVGKTATKLSLDLFNVRVDLRDGRVTLCLKNWAADPGPPAQTSQCQMHVELEGEAGFGKVGEDGGHPLSTRTFS